MFDTPTLNNVRVPALPIANTSIVELEGDNFPSGYEYNCIFSLKFGHLQFRTNATYFST